MSLLDQIKSDIKQITGNSDEFARQMTLTPPNGQQLTISGLHTKIHLGVDTEGNMINSKKAHIAFSEQLIIDAGSSIRNPKGEVDLKNYRVSVIDSTGTSKNYIMQSWFPDETIGLLTCILESYE